MKYALLLLSLATFACGKKANTEPAKEVKTTTVSKQEVQQEPVVSKVVDVNEFAKVIKKEGVLLLDVRTPGEYQAGHIEGAKNLNFFDDDFKKQLNTLNKKQAIAVYCKSGHRSGKTRELLKKIGFTEVYDLDGGFMSWSASHK